MRALIPSTLRGVIALERGRNGNAHPRPLRRLRACGGRLLAEMRLAFAVERVASTVRPSIWFGGHEHALYNFLRQTLAGAFGALLARKRHAAGVEGFY